MTTNDNHAQAATLDARDYLGNYLKKEDVNGPTEVTVTDVRAEPVPGASRRKLVVQFKEFEKPLVLNSTNIKRLAANFGTHNTASWRGPICLYVDERVEYAGTTVGGIRVRPAPEAVQGVSQVPSANGVSTGHFA